jgi:uncharacterized membrane protein/mono/diheme cytochrome c family protein
MKLFQRILSGLSLFFTVMLLFLLCFENRVTLPPALQSTGRMHPLLLHLPIGFMILSLLFWLIRKNIGEESFRKMFILLLHLSAFMASLSALAGFFLSREGGYDDTTLSLHKWTGAATALLSYLLVWLYNIASSKKFVFGTTLVASIVLLVLASHFGATLTHGEGFVLQPLKGEKNEEAEIITDSSSLFAAAIRPVLKSKCFSCHNEKKAKGGLVMTSEEKLLAGGKNGPIWKSGDALNSHIIENINLPEEDKKHMPPKGKPQLTEDEVQLLFAWIQSGADMKKRMADYNEYDSLKLLTIKFIRNEKPTMEERTYPFDQASPALIEKLNTPFCTVFPVAQNSPALQANFFVREKFDNKHLDELLKIKEQLLVLNLGNMPVADADMKIISRFRNLEKLILNNASVTNAGMEEIKNLKHLRSLSVTGTKIDKNAAAFFSQADSLKEVFVWNTPMAVDAAALQKQYSNIIFNNGYAPDKNEMLMLTAPAVKNEEFILEAGAKAELKHPIAGTTIRITTDGTIPDSSTSPVYSHPVSLKGFTRLNARAVKPGWYSSPVASFSFYEKGTKPSVAKLVNEPNEKYKSSGIETLLDLRKGTAENFGDGTWLGYREKYFSGEFYFDSDKIISSISISYAVNVQSYILPPAEIEVWSVAGTGKLKLIKNAKLPPVTKEELNTIKTEGIKIELPPAAYRQFRVVVKNIQKLPAWHPGKGDKGWVFLDEIFFN